MKKIALILDLDDTLYNWMDVFALSLETQINYIAKETRVTKQRIRESFKKVFQKHGSVEVINAANELDIWSEIKREKAEIDNIKQHSTKVFFKTFSEKIALFPTVLETLEWAMKNKIIIFAFSNANAFWINFRLEQLKIKNFFEKIYVLENEFHKEETNSKTNIVMLPKDKIKPNTFIIDKIKRDYQLQKKNMYFVGDSKNIDICTSQKARINSIWAQYGKNYSKKSGKLLSAITPWPKSEKYTKYPKLPQYTIKEFAEIKDIIKL